MNRGAFLVLTHTHFPIAKGENAGKVRTTETCEFLDRYKAKHIRTATIIIDVINRKFIKNTYRQDGLTYDQIEEHIIRGYADKYKRFLEVVGAEVPEALLMSNEEVEAEIEKLAETEEKDASV